MTTEKNDNKIEETADDSFKFKGRYVRAIGSRKTAKAEIRIYLSGKGVVMINNLPAKKVFTADQLAILNQALKLTGRLRDHDVSVVVRGGGKKAQAEAGRLAITKALVIIDKELQPALKSKGYLTRDARRKERKKPGLKRARRAPQWSKR